MSIAVLCVIAQVSACASADERDRGGERPEVRAPARAERPNGRLGTSGVNRAAFEGRGQVLDGRVANGRYYPPVGSVTRSLSGEYRPYYRGNDRYYFNSGVWYAPRGPGFVVVHPPPGLVISVLPPFYSTVWFGGSPYYYAGDVYYTWQPDQNGYAVADPPADADRPSSPPDSVATDQNLVLYPKNGQSKEQQGADQFECHTWAKGQSGFDPTQADGGASSNSAQSSRGNYDRAMSACLQGRGYQVE